MIGVFDSGVGGLTVLKELVKELGDYDYIYLGDTARVPYGMRSPETIYEFSRQGVDFLFKKGCEVVIIACNTASARALKQLQEKYLTQNYPERRLLGVIRPLVEEAARVSKGRIGVIGTRATIRSGAYPAELEKLRKDLKIYQAAAPLLVPLIEEGWLKKPEARIILKKYLRPLKAKQIDTLILGCTHYPIWQDYIAKVMGKNCLALNSGEVIAKSFVNYLERHPEIEKKLTKNKKILFFTTDEVSGFNVLAQRFFGAPIKAQKVNIG